MSLGFYRLIHGRLIVRQRQSPDGDSMRFIADDMTLFDDLPRSSPPSATANGEESYQLRFQAIDTPELHYGGAAQPHGRESRDGLLRWLEEDPTHWNWQVAPTDFAWEKEASILCDGFEGHGRPIAFVLPRAAGDDGSEVKLTTALLETTYNYVAVHTGLAYLGLYSGGLSFPIQSALRNAYEHAKEQQSGIWALDTTARFTVNTLEDINENSTQLVYPKVFRRCVDALRWAGGEFEPGRDVDDYLLEIPRENDAFVVHAAGDGRLKSRLSDVLEQINNQIRIQVDLNLVEFVSK